MEYKDLIKGYLISNPDDIEILLDSFGFHSFNRRRNSIRCALPERNNGTSVEVNLDTLYSSIYTSPDYKGDLFGMLLHWNKHFGNNYGWNFYSVLQIIDERIIKGRLDDLNEEQLYNSLKLSKQKYDKKLNAENQEYDLSYLDEYETAYNLRFLRDDILPKTQKKYSIRYDTYDQRILIPHFKYDDKSKIVGIQGRTNYNNYEKLGIPKYINYIDGFKKSRNLYGLSHNIDTIRENKQLVIFESEKSVMKLDSLEYLNLFPSIGVALGGSSLSDWQADYLSQLSSKIEGLEIIIALDKDIRRDIVKMICSKLKQAGCKKVSYIFDTENILEEKAAPVDKDYYRWKVLFNSRIQF